MPRRGRSSNFVTIELVFERPKGHRIRARITHALSPNCLSEIDAQKFDFKCPRCGWKGIERGNRRIPPLRQVE
jgi:hypothetical protein